MDGARERETERHLANALDDCVLLRRTAVQILYTMSARLRWSCVAWLMILMSGMSFGWKYPMRSPLSSMPSARLAKRLSDSSSTDSESPPVRRIHVNKYADKSRKQEDPFERALQLAAEGESLPNKSVASEDTLRFGTTVPNAQPHSLRNASCKPRHEGYAKIDPRDPTTFGYHEIGKIIGAHGVQGEVKIAFESDFVEHRIRNSSVLYLKHPRRRSPRAIRVQLGRKQVDSIYIVQFEGVNSRFVAHLLRGHTVFVLSTDSVPLKENEFLVRDLVGMQCYASRRDPLDTEHCSPTTVNTPMEPFAVIVSALPAEELFSPSIAAKMHSMLEIRLLRSHERCLVPFVPSIVLHVDSTARRVELDLPHGLLDLRYTPTPEKVCVRGYLPQRSAVLTTEERQQLQLRTTLTYRVGGERTLLDEI